MTAGELFIDEDTPPVLRLFVMTNLKTRQGVADVVDISSGEECCGGPLDKRGPNR